MCAPAAGRWTSPIYVGMDLMSRLFFPYDMNPKGANPLREILAEPWIRAAAQSPIKFFITATNVRLAAVTCSEQRHYAGFCSPRPASPHDRRSS
jgi:hypothetical protein